jgi:hypothetical protein
MQLNMRTTFLNPPLTSPMVPQNPLRASSSGCSGLGNCGCGGCGCGPRQNGGPVQRTLAGIGRASLRGTSLGQVDDEVLAYQTPQWLQVTLGLVSLASGAAGAYHGYKRHDSVWGALGWSLLGFWFWPISMPVAFAQGFAERK